MGSSVGVMIKAMSLILVMEHWYVYCVWIKSCMKNLVLSSPTSCDCPLETTRQIIERNVFCVWDSGKTSEAC